jgi:hypothetical protein
MRELRTGNSGRYRYYTCATRAQQGKVACNGRSIPMEKLDRLMSERAFLFLRCYRECPVDAVSVLPRCCPEQIAASQPMTVQRITKHTVDALKSNCSEFTVWDDAVTGFGVRMRPTGAKSRVIETLDQSGSDYRYVKVTCDDGCLYILRYDAAREDWGLTMFESACSRTG